MLLSISRNVVMTFGTVLWRNVRRYVDSVLASLSNKGPQGTLNARINILYMLDSLCESSLVADRSMHSQSQGNPSTSTLDSDIQNTVNAPFYIGLVKKDLPKLVDLVVPESREGLANLMSTMQVSSSTPLT